MPRRCVVGGCNNMNRDGFKLQRCESGKKLVRNLFKIRGCGESRRNGQSFVPHRRKLCYDRDGKNVWISCDTLSRCISNDKVKSAARPPLNVPECVSYSGTKDLDSTASNGGSLFPQTSELNPLDVLAHSASTVPYATEDDQEKNTDPSFPGLLTTTPKLDRSAFRKRERMRVLQDIFSNSYRHLTEEDDYQTFSRADIGVQIYPDVKSKGVQVKVNDVKLKMVSTGTQCELIKPPMDPEEASDEEMESDEESIASEESMECGDPDYMPDEDDHDNSFNIPAAPLSDLPQRQRLFLVYEGALMDLFSHFSACQSECECKLQRMRGSSITVHQKCLGCNFQRLWHSQPSEMYQLGI
ncbi:uncharacterized protein LOC133560644 [Nerophis ophidion]|uniref:uncharacterized protein LOC133560644 n=1 Tax=Nerophis ophidion TaxID=159077 RepID=UPI002AE07582|nr:uncharacterized protein LOC133560644 [Nerophis ophidion]